ncbi:MAG: hypothetical protein ACREM9_09215 [Gemmatimonadales bacterium]
MRLRLTVLGLAATAACSPQDGFLDPDDAAPSRAFGIWSPGSHDTCTQQQHDAYAVLGPDGKAYPTWHPPTGPGGCSFGHEHGRDPSGSDLSDDLGGLPFGYASEMRAASDPTHPRDEDHVGHKVEWENDVQLALSGEGVTSSTTLCDVLLKLHQGTHSKDAFTNNLHELVYHLRCEDGTEMHVTLLVVIGRPGRFARSCSPNEYVSAGAPAPANSPAGFGVRLIPDRTCIERHMLAAPGQPSDYAAALHESWQVYNSVERTDGHALAFFNPYFQVGLPSRFYDPALASDIGRPVAICYEVTPAGARATGGPCEASTANGTVPGVAFDDPRSTFNGTDRVVDINAVKIANPGGPEAWYTDALGHQARTTPFPGSIRQSIAPVDRYIGVDIGGPSLGGDRPYSGPGVRAPN